MLTLVFNLASIAVFAIHPVSGSSCWIKPTSGDCVFPFIYNKISYKKCTNVDFGSQYWCATTSNYDKDKKWKKCPPPREPVCKVKTTKGECCVFPFIYKGKSYPSCTTVDYGKKLWCATTSNYDKDRKWGQCARNSVASCTTKTTAGICCVFPFIYKGKTYQSCTTVNNGHTYWCATTSNYDKHHKWGNCQKQGTTSCTEKTTSGICCVFPFIYKGKTYKSCTTVDYGKTYWCATTSNYDKNGKWGTCQKQAWGKRFLKDYLQEKKLEIVEPLHSSKDNIWQDYVEEMEKGA